MPPSQFQRAVEPGSVWWESPCKRLCEATEGSCESKVWVSVETTDVGDSMTVRHLPRRAVYRGWNQPKREKHDAGSKLGGVEHSKSFGAGPVAIGFAVCPAVFLSCFGPAFPYCALIPLFWNANSQNVILTLRRDFKIWTFKKFWVFLMLD